MHDAIITIKRQKRTVTVSNPAEASILEISFRITTLSSTTSIFSYQLSNLWYGKKKTGVFKILSYLEKKLYVQLVNLVGL